MTRPPSTLNRIVSLLRVGPRGLVLRFVDQGSRLWTGRPLWRYSRITPQLYVGGQHRPRGWGAMTAEGISAVVNMREAHLDDAKKGIQSACYLHLATRDNTPPTLDDLLRGAQFIAQQVAAGGKVYIHCGVGVGRAPTQAAAYLVYSGLSADEALALIRRARPFIHLTSSQRRQLAEFEARYRGRLQAETS
ncbi:dual specificity protein phosphatase [Aggregatilineales bacterium SYSU G02658]